MGWLAAISLVQRLSVASQRKVTFCAAGAGLGMAAAFLYGLHTPVQYESVATFVVAPSSLAANASAGAQALGGALSFLGNEGNFSETDVYISQIKSHDLMMNFLQSHPEVLKAYSPFFPNGYPTITNQNGIKSLSPAVADRFRTEFARIVPTASARIFQLSVRAPAPSAATNAGKILLSSMNAVVRNSALQEHQGRIDFLRQQLATAEGNVDLRSSIAQLTTEELRMLTLVAGSPDYGVRIIDTPSEPISPLWPQFSVLLGLGFINGVLIGGFIYWLVYSRRWF